MFVRKKHAKSKLDLENPAKYDLNCLSMIMLLFADDIALFTQHPASLQNQLEGYLFVDGFKRNGNKLRIEFHSGCIYGIMNAMVKLANPWSASLNFILGAFMGSWTQWSNWQIHEARYYGLYYKIIHNVDCYEKPTPVMRLCNYRLINATVFLIKMLVECKYTQMCILKREKVIAILIRRSIMKLLKLVVFPYLLFVKKEV